MPVHSLAAGEKQKLEILKQLYLKRTLFFLDEPTSVLTPAEADEVLGLLHAHDAQARADGADHHAQVPRSDCVCDEVTVLRRGKLRRRRQGQ